MKPSDRKKTGTPATGFRQVENHLRELGMNYERIGDTVLRINEFGENGTIVQVAISYNDIIDSFTLVIGGDIVASDKNLVEVLRYLNTVNGGAFGSFCFVCPCCKQVCSQLLRSLPMTQLSREQLKRALDEAYVDFALFVTPVQAITIDEGSADNASKILESIMEKYTAPDEAQIQGGVK